MIDLHVHTNNSDGSDSVEDVIKKAKELQLTQIAITDHNTLKGSLKAHELYPEHTIVGTELSVGYKDNELHLLGYFPQGSNQHNYKHVLFVIDEGEIQKSIATAEMVERLNAEGYRINVNELAMFTNGVINRVHICRALMKHDYISSVQEGFEKLVGDHCPAYVKRKYTPIEEAVEAIHEDGGIAIIAHPYNYKPLAGQEVEMLDDIIHLVDGIECMHPSASEEQSFFLIDYAKKHGKRITGGSDYHGENKPNISLSMMNVQDEYQIKE